MLMQIGAVELGALQGYTSTQIRDALHKAQLALALPCSRSLSIRIQTAYGVQLVQIANIYRPVRGRRPVDERTGD